MIISDLNHVEIVSESIQVEGGSDYSFYENDYFRLDIVSSPQIKGNSALALADSVALGTNTFAKTITNTEVVANRSSLASSLSVAGYTP